MPRPKKRQVARSPEDLAAKRDQILDAAMACLLDKGFARSTMSDVATQADIGRGTVYWHFPSKDDLFLAVVQRETDKVTTELEPLLAMPMPAADKLELMISGTFDMYADVPHLFKAFLSILTGGGEELEQKLEAQLADIYRQYNQVVTDLLEEGKREGTVRPELDSPITGASIVVLLDALFLQIHFGLIDNDPPRLAAAVGDFIKRGCLVCPPSATDAPRGTP
jgi:AcrR family transcriptional regulator